MPSSPELHALELAELELRAASQKWDAALVAAMVAGASITELAAAVGRSRSVTHRALVNARRRELRRKYRDGDDGA